LKEKKLPSWIQNETLRQLLRSRLGVVLSYWIFQGVLYADYREILLKCLIDGALTFLLAAILDVPFYLSLIAAHTLNMVFNGHVIAMRRHMGLGANNPAKFIAYIEKFDERVRSKPYIRAVAAFGSLTRGSYRPTSDIDVRIVPKEGQVSFCRACLFALTERTRAILSGFPLDLYVFSEAELKNKMNPAETPMVFHDPQGWLKQSYKNVVSAAQIIASFKRKYV